MGGLGGGGGMRLKGKGKNEVSKITHELPVVLAGESIYRFKILFYFCISLHILIINS